VQNNQHSAAVRATRMIAKSYRERCVKTTLNDAQIIQREYQPLIDAAQAVLNAGFCGREDSAQKAARKALSLEVGRATGWKGETEC
jgi:hypothetical protein